MKSTTIAEILSRKARTEATRECQECLPTCLE